MLRIRSLRRRPRKWTLADLPRGGASVLRWLLAKDPVTAFACLEATAGQGLVEAQVALGQCLLDGIGCAADPARAAVWFAVAARAGHPPAMNMLGRCRERGWGGAIDVTEAAQWYRRAAELGLDWAQYNLANALLRGRGLPRDRPASYGWFCAAAAQGHAKSMNLVGRFHEEGWEVPQDSIVAGRWYRQAAAGGDYRGAFNWGSWLAQRGHLAPAAEQFMAAAAAATPDLLQVMAQALKGRPEFSPALTLSQQRLAGRIS